MDEIPQTREDADRILRENADKDKLDRYQKTIGWFAGAGLAVLLGGAVLFGKEPWAFTAGSVAGVLLGFATAMQVMEKSIRQWIDRLQIEGR